MVFAGVSKSGKKNLTFIDPGIKINGTYCHYVLLIEQQLCEISGEQDSGPAHCACKTISFHFT